MASIHEGRARKLLGAMEAAGIPLAVIADPDAVAYFAGYWNYLGVEFGRPTLLVLDIDAPPVLITPLMEAEMCGRMTWIGDIRSWTDGGEEWRAPLADVLRRQGIARIGIEKGTLPARVAQALEVLLAGGERVDISPQIAGLRMIKDADEISIMRQAGQVAVAMMAAARETIAVGVPEYEVTLAAMAAGSRKAASFLSDPVDRFTSPLIHGLQVLQSGRDTCMVHRRSGVRRLKTGDPVYLCFCGMASFRNYKLGFDREFFVGSVSEEQARIQETAVAAQQAALAVIRPGVTCEAVNAASEAVYSAAGFGAGYRTGRSIGMSFLEAPELKKGENRVLEAGMTFAVDGGITVPGAFGGRIGDSIVVTGTGFDYLTPYPRDLTIL